MGGFLKEGTYGYYLTSKGYNARVLCEWLMDTFVAVNARPEAFPTLVPDPRAHVAESTLTFGCNQRNCTLTTIKEFNIFNKHRDSGGGFVATST